MAHRNSTARTGILALLPALGLLTACSVHPPQVPAGSLPPTGLVIGAVSYPVGTEAPDSVQFERVDTSTAVAAYRLMLRTDSQQGQASYAGFLPAGVYRLRAAEARGRQFEPSSHALPFELGPGAIHHVGTHAVAPARRTTLAGASTALH